MVTALAHGAQAIVPVAEIPEALSEKVGRPDALLAGERNGLRIDAALTSVEFDLAIRRANSPRIGSSAAPSSCPRPTAPGPCGLARPRSRRSRALLNLGTVAAGLLRIAPPSPAVCSGTAGTSILRAHPRRRRPGHQSWSVYGEGGVADSAQLARESIRVMPPICPAVCFAWRGTDDGCWPGRNWPRTWRSVCGRTCFTSLPCSGLYHRPLVALGN